MVDLFCFLTNLLLSDIPFLYYYINLRLSIISCLSSGDVTLSLGILLLSLFVTVSELFYCEFFGTLVISSAILLSTKSRFASVFF